jgi:hypothetical protein
MALLGACTESSASGQIRSAGDSEPAGNVLFESDWTHAAGTSSAALNDGGRWTHARPRGRLTIIAAAGLGFPAGMVNVMRTEILGHESAEVGMVANTLPAPVAGSHRYYRVYVRFNERAVNGGFDHSLQLSHQDVGGTGFAWKFRPTAGGIDVEIQNRYEVIGGTASGASLDYLNGYRKKLQRNVAYRMEKHISFPTASTVRLEGARVHRVNADGSETLLYDSRDFDVFDSGTGGNFRSSLAAYKPTADIPDTAIFRRYMIGYNGQTGWENLGGMATGDVRFYGGFAVCRDSWCGPYQPRH